MVVEACHHVKPENHLKCVNHYSDIRCSSLAFMATQARYTGSSNHMLNPMCSGAACAGTMHPCPYYLVHDAFLWLRCMCASAIEAMWRRAEPRRLLFGSGTFRLANVQFLIVQGLLERGHRPGGLPLVPAFDSKACDCKCLFRAVHFVPAKAFWFTLQQRHFIKSVFLCFGGVAHNDASLQSSPQRQLGSESTRKTRPADTCFSSRYLASLGLVFCLAGAM